MEFHGSRVCEAVRRTWRLLGLFGFNCPMRKQDTFELTNSKLSRNLKKCQIPKINVSAKKILAFGRRRI